jgi:hypothetical protein
VRTLESFGLLSVVTGVAQLASEANLKLCGGRRDSPTLLHLSKVGLRRFIAITIMGLVYFRLR